MSHMEIVNPTMLFHLLLKRARNISFYLSIFFCSWGMGFQNFGLGGAISKLFPVLACFFIIFSILLFRKNFSSFPKIIIVFFLFALLHSLLTYTQFVPISIENSYVPIYRGMRIDYIESPYIRLLRVILFVLFSFCSASFLVSEKRIKRFTFFYASGLALMIIISGILGGVISASRSGVIRYAGAFFDPNILGYFCMVGIFLVICNFFSCNSDRSNKTTLFAGFLVSVQTCGILNSGSRSALLGTLSGLIVIFIWGKERLISKRNILPLAMISLAAVTAILIVSDNAVNMLIGRSKIEVMMAGGGSGRIEIWTDYLVQIQKYFFIGVGPMLSADLNYKGQVCHNTYLTILVELGIVGLLLYIWGMINLFKTIASRNIACELSGLKKCALALLISVSVSNFFIDAFSMRAMWVALAMVAAISHADIKLKSMARHYGNMGVLSR